MYAVLTSTWAVAATASETWTLPPRVTNGKPVMALPGLRPTSPEIVEGPVFVMVDAATMENETAVPRSGATAPSTPGMQPPPIIIAIMAPLGPPAAGASADRLPSKADTAAATIAVTVTTRTAGLVLSLRLFALNFKLHLRLGAVPGGAPLRGR